MTFFLILMLSFGGRAQERDAQEAFESLRALLPPMCAGNSPLRRCFEVSDEACRSRIAASFEGCVRDQRIKFAGRPTLDFHSVVLAEEGVKECVTRDFAKSNMHAGRKGPGCAALMPPKADVRGAKKRAGPTAFEESADEKRGLESWYRARLTSDVRAATQLAQAVESRRACPKKEESRADCFRRLLNEAPLTSSSQVEALLESARRVAVDLPLAVFEKVNLADFHLATYKARTDAEKVLLNQLRVTDSEKLLALATATGKSLETRITAGSGMGELRRRVNDLKARKWIYPPSL